MLWDWKETSPPFLKSLNWSGMNDAKKARVNSMAQVSTRQCNKKKELLQNYTFLILKECTAESIFHLYNYLDEGCTQKTFLSLIRSTGHHWIAWYQVLDILQAKSWSMPFIRTDHWHVTLAQMNKYEGWLHKVKTYSINQKDEIYLLHIPNCVSLMVLVRLWLQSTIHSTSKLQTEEGPWNSVPK